MAGRRGSRVSLKDLLNAGLLQAGEEFTCEPRRGEIYRATLKADGSIVYKERVFQSPGGWAVSVAGNQRDGWRDVKARGRPLDDYRQDYKSGKATISKPEVKSKEEHTRETPDKQPTIASDLATLAQQNRDQVRKAIKDRLMAVTPKGFEELVAVLLKSFGFSEIEVTGRSNDGGIDGLCTHPVLKLTLPFQAKRWTNSVGVDPVSSFCGRIANKYPKGIFITTSSFSSAARASANEWQEIELIDGESLVDFMISQGLGVKERPLTYMETDESFFTQFS